jgi:hypothetical protein
MLLDFSMAFLFIRGFHVFRFKSGVKVPCGWSWVENSLNDEKKRKEIDLSIDNLDIKAITLRVNRLVERENLRRKR